MIDFRNIDEITRKLTENIPENLKHLKTDMEANFKAVLASTFDKMDLVTREEFDAQKKVLQRTREKIDELETRLNQEND